MGEGRRVRRIRVRGGCVWLERCNFTEVILCPAGWPRTSQRRCFPLLGDLEPHRDGITRCWVT